MQHFNEPKTKYSVHLTCPITFKKRPALMRPNTFFFFFSYSRHLRIDTKALLLMCFQEQLKFIECSFISPLSTDAWRQRWTNTGTTMTRGHTRSHTWGWRWYLQWWHAWCGWQLPRHSQTSANNCEYETLSAPVCRHEARPEQWERQNLHCQHNN